MEPFLVLHLFIYFAQLSLCSHLKLEFVSTASKPGVIPKTLNISPTYLLCIVSAYILSIYTQEWDGRFPTVSHGGLFLPADPKVVGFAMYYFTYDPWVGKQLYLEEFYVMDEYRGKNISICCCLHSLLLCSFIHGLNFSSFCRAGHRFRDPAAPQQCECLQTKVHPDFGCSFEHTNLNSSPSSSSWRWRRAAPAWCSWWQRTTSRRSSSTSAAVPRTSLRRRAGGSSGLTRTASSRWPLHPRNERPDRAEAASAFQKSSALKHSIYHSNLVYLICM